jgi:hypothetical protein
MAENTGGAKKPEPTGPRWRACSTVPAAEATMAMLTTLRAVSASAFAACTTMTTSTRYIDRRKAY